MEKPNDGSWVDMLLGWESPRVVFHGWEDVIRPPEAPPAHEIAIYLEFITMIGSMTDVRTGRRYSRITCPPWEPVLVEETREEIQEMFQQMIAADNGNDEGSCLRGSGGGVDGSGT